MSAVSRPDPAPSRLRYRYQRVMLTPLYRLMLRVGVPFALAFGGASLWLAQPENRDVIAGFVTETRRSFEQRPEFMVKLMAVDGAGPGTAADIRAVLPVDFPISSFDLDLAAMRDRVAGLDAVENARLFIRKGGVLQVDVTERMPVALWRTAAGLELIDRNGVMTGPVAARADHPGLPVIAGAGAAHRVGEALALASAARPIQDRLRGFVRVGERRWNVVLDRDQRILLPEEGAVRALERVVAMDQVVDLLERDIVDVDLRLPDRPTLKMSAHAQSELRRIKAIEAGSDG